ncbi:ankyrin repeat domain-containing protein 39 isoform X3 [Anguilla anguilla]|uniref:ankyrin repeat domain-containing protein 39 isoform X3 n=1 Tax=Anguilla anguilla TaxID=7936 RepID=UPI0015B1C8D9|nr:ankyrin repeat domain-containing protein 39 isoform X3 [Anguilla anguilla]
MRLFPQFNRWRKNGKHSILRRDRHRALTSMASEGQRCACCAQNLAAPSAHQTLDEMDFERGIWAAALNGDLERVKSLLQKGTSPNVRDQAGYTALHYASRAGNEAVCELLLDGGACANPQTQGGATPLHRSAYCGHLGVVKLLLDHGADPLLCDDDGSSPLHKAAEQGQAEVCELLLQRCPTLRTLTDKRSRPPYQLVQESSPVREMLRPLDD